MIRQKEYSIRITKRSVTRENHNKHTERNDLCMMKSVQTQEFFYVFEEVCLPRLQIIKNTLKIVILWNIFTILKELKNVKIYFKIFSVIFRNHLNIVIWCSVTNDCTYYQC